MVPLYDFECPSCGHKFDSTEKMGTTETQCPVCLGTAKLVFSSNITYVINGNNDASVTPKKRKR